jgi:hypothetical protein
MTFWYLKSMNKKFSALFMNVPEISKTEDTVKNFLHLYLGVKTQWLIGPTSSLDWKLKDSHLCCCTLDIKTVV